jgi:hypothetical protein
MNKQCLRCHRVLPGRDEECPSCGGPAVPLGSVPVAVPEPVGPPPPGWLRPVHALGTALVVLLGANLVVDVVAFFDDGERRRIFTRLAEGTVSVAEAAASDSRTQAIATAQLLLLAATGVLTFVWLYRVYVNAGRFGSQLPHRARWAVWAWLVPFLNFVRPRRIVDQAWRASDPALPPGNAVAWTAARTSAVIMTWWVVFLVSSILSNVGARLTTSEANSAVREGYGVLVLADGLDAVAAVLFAVVVWRLTARQAARIAALGG